MQRNDLNSAMSRYEEAYAIALRLVQLNPDDETYALHLVFSSVSLWAASNDASYLRSALDFAQSMKVKDMLAFNDGSLVQDLRLMLTDD